MTADTATKTLTERLAELEALPRDWTCDVHGVEYGEGKPHPHRVTWECPACERDAYLAEREFHQAHARYRHWLASGVPRRYGPASPEHIQPHNPSAKILSTFVRDFVANLEDRVDAGVGALILGPPGLGKTVALAAICNCSYRVMDGAAYRTWPDVIADLKAGFNGPRDDPRRQAVAELRTVPLLLLDELAVKGQSEFEHSELFTLIDYRYREGLPTIAAANSTRSAFPSMVGERVADRLFEVGPTIVLTGESMRGKTRIDGPDALKPPPDKLVTRVHSMGRMRERTIQAPRRYGDGYTPLPGEI